MGFSLFFVADLINKRFGLLPAAPEDKTAQLKKDDEEAGFAETELELEDSSMLDKSRT